MKLSLNPRLRSPVILLAAEFVAAVIGVSTYGWSSLASVLPILVLIPVALYVLGGRDSDVGAAVRKRLDERQEMQRLKVQALVGRVSSVAVAVAYFVAVVTDASLWPWAALLGVIAVAFVAGWLLYGEHDHGDGEDDAWGSQ